MKRKGFTLDDLKNSKAASLNQHLFISNTKKNKKTNKYNNLKTIVDDIEFDSKKEAERYKTLKLQLKAGIIGLLRMQVPYELNPGGTHSLIYMADFVYFDIASGEEIVEDAKGTLTAVYKKKRRLMKKVHGINIKET